MPAQSALAYRLRDRVNAVLYAGTGQPEGMPAGAPAAGENIWNSPPEETRE